MNVKDAIDKRRAYRSIEGIEVDDNIIKDLAIHASLAPSCFNKQPWRFVFVRTKEKLKDIFDTLPEGNKWAKNASLVVAVYSRKDFDEIARIL